MWNTESDADESFRKKVIWGSAAIVVIGLVGAVYYYKYHSAVPETPVVKEAPKPPVEAPQAATEPAVRNPIPETADTKPLPPLKQSDPDVRQALINVFGAKAVTQFLVPENVIRHIVVTVDNLPRKKVAAELRPLQPTPGDTAVDTQGSSTSLSQQNYARYAALMDVVRSVDPKALATIYFRLYPLFQQAYENLGYPGKYFNDRMVQAIDSLLATPDVQGPIALVRPKVFYQFADPRLEALPAGQKLLIRMGPQNASLVKSKLQQFRAAITAQPPQMSQPAQTAPTPQPAAPPPQGNSGAQTNPLPPGTQATPSTPPSTPPTQTQSPPPQ